MDILPFTKASKKNKIARRKQAQGGKDLYSVNFKSLKEEIEKDTRKEKDTLTPFS